MKKFHDRTDAGRQLATCLQTYATRADTVVLGLPRGGVPVAYEISHALSVPLDLCLARKLSVPRSEEMAFGAIAPGGVRVLNDGVIRSLKVSKGEIEQAIAEEQIALQRLQQMCRGSRPQIDICDRTVILVDDGIATGATAKAALAILRSQKPKEVVLAVPVAPQSECHHFRAMVDQLVCLMMPHPFRAISLWYEDFSQVTDAQVRDLLGKYPIEMAKLVESRSDQFGLTT